MTSGAMTIQHDHRKLQNVVDNNQSAVLDLLDSFSTLGQRAESKISKFVMEVRQKNGEVDFSRL